MVSQPSRPGARYTRTIAEFVHRPRFEDLPIALVDKAKSAFLDCSGVMVAGSREAPGKIASDSVREIGGLPESGVIAAGLKVPASQAAFANAVMAHAMDYDDMHGQARCHATAILAPVIFALGERGQISGRQAIAAYAVGLELVWHIGRDFTAHSRAPGIHATSLSGTMGATCAAARLLGLDVAVTEMALGIAASATGGVRGNVGSMSKAFHTGSAARNGILAATLASKGFTAEPDTFDSEWGFAATYAAETGPTNQFLAGLGDPFGAHEALEFKIYPACGKVHASLDAMFQLIDTYDLRAEQVDRIECLTSDEVLGSLIHHRPQTGLAAKFSMEYALAIAVLDRAAGIRQFTDERVRDPAAQAFMEKVHYVHPPDLRGAENLLSTETVVVRLKDGRTVSHQAKRLPERLGGDVAPQALEQKYRDCVEPTLSAVHAEETLRLLHNLERVEDVSALTRILCLTA